MLKSLFTTLPFVLLLLGCQSSRPGATNDRENTAAAIVQQIVRQVGSTEDLLAARDISYRYTFHHLPSDKKDISTERYLFAGGKSWARYDHHEYAVLPNRPGRVAQADNGKRTTAAIEEDLITDAATLAAASRTRRANTYWLTVLAKLEDKGVRTKLLADRRLKGSLYKVLEVTFEPNAGSAEDKLILYVNPQSWTVDQLLFTLPDLGWREPHLMEVRYTYVQGITLMSHRQISRANWRGEPLGPVQYEQKMESIRFGTSVPAALFEQAFVTPVSGKDLSR